ncbi:MAG: hemolysin family protein [Gammaproteobacteria bacterium]
MELTLSTPLAIVALLAANAFFVAAEFALVKARGFRIEAQMQEGSRTAAMTHHIQAHIEPYLAACQLGITMASLGLGWIGEPAVAALVEPMFTAAGMSTEHVHLVAFLIGFIVFSSLHIVVGEQVPKTFAIRQPEMVSLWIAYPLHVFYVTVYPLNWALNRASGAILGLFGVAEATHGEVLTDQELRGLITVSREHGEIAENKADMLSNLFAFDERTVGRVMIPRGDVEMLDAAAPAAENMRRVREHLHSRFPLYDGDPAHPVGLILTKELYHALIDGKTDPWADLRAYRRDAPVVPETLRIAELFDVMRSQRVHMAFVVDEYGEFVGLVTLEDLIEEIVGDIADETDEPEQEYPIEAGDAGWRAHGLATLANVHRVTGLDTPDSLAANTLSGLFMQRLGRMPEVGDTLVEGGYTLEVLAVAEHRVDSVGIAPPADAAAAAAASPAPDVGNGD